MAIPVGVPVMTPEVAEAVKLAVVDNEMVDTSITESVLLGFVRLLKMDPEAEAVACSLEGRAVALDEAEAVALAGADADADAVALGDAPGRVAEEVALADAVERYECTEIDTLPGRMVPEAGM